MKLHVEYAEHESYLDGGVYVLATADNRIYLEAAQKGRKPNILKNLIRIAAASNKETYVYLKDRQTGREHRVSKNIMMADIILLSEPDNKMPYSVHAGKAAAEVRRRKMYA